MFVLATCASNREIEIGVKAGSQLSLHASAQGKVFLAFGRSTMMDALRQMPMTAITPLTITDPDLLAAEIALVKQRGYAVAPEESLLGVNALAAPIYNYDSSLIGSIGLIGSVQHIEREPQAAMIERLLRLTSEVSRSLGFRLE